LLAKRLQGERALELFEVGVHEVIYGELDRLFLEHVVDEGVRVHKDDQVIGVYLDVQLHLAQDFGGLLEQIVVLNFLGLSDGHLDGHPGRLIVFVLLLQESQVDQTLRLVAQIQVALEHLLRVLQVFAHVFEPVALVGFPEVAEEELGAQEDATGNSQLFGGVFEDLESVLKGVL